MAGKSIREMVESGELALEPGERLADSGVIVGSGAHPDVLRFGAEEFASYDPAVRGE